MKQLIEKIENLDMTVGRWLATLWSIIVIRLILESFSANGLDLYEMAGIFLHSPLFYFAMALSLVIFFRLLIKESFKKLFNVTLIGFTAILIPPFVDFLFSGGKGNIQTHYLADPLPQLLRDYITFFGPELKSGVTYGIRAQVLVIVALIIIYTFHKTRKYWKTALAALGAYTIFFIYGSMPALVGAFSYLPENPYAITKLEIIQKFMVPRNIFAIPYGAERILELFDIEMALIFIPFVCIQLVIVFYMWDKQKFFAFFRKLRYLRLLFHYAALVIGIVIGMNVYDTGLDLGLYGVLALIALFFATTSVWVFALTTNDRHDIAIDRITNKERMLVVGEFTEKEFENISLITFLLAILCSFALGYNFLVLFILSLLLAYIYSYPPLRLRRFPIVAPFMMALGTAALILVGFLLFSPSGTFFDFPINFFFLMVFVVALVTNIKDIKDLEGDKANGIYTIPTLFGEKRSKIIISLLFVLSYLLFPIILKTEKLIISSIVFSIFSALLINNKKVNEKLVFGVYSLFLLIVAFIVF